MLDLLFRSRFRWRLRPRSVTGDAAYGTVENVAAVEKAGVRAYVVLPKHDERRGALFAKNEFAYDAEKDLYACPKARPCAAKGSTTRREAHQVRRQALRLQPVPAQDSLHEERGEGTLAQAQLRGGVPRKGARLPRHRALPQGVEEAPGVGRAPLCRGQGLQASSSFAAKGWTIAPHGLFYVQWLIEKTGENWPIRYARSYAKSGEKARQAPL